MGRTFRYGVGITGICLAVMAAGQLAGPGRVAASPAHPAAPRAPAHLAMAVGQHDLTLGRAATLNAPPPHATPSPAAPALTVCSFDGSRSRSPFATATGDLGYDQMRADLLDPAKFGPSGTVHRTVIIAAGVPAITSSDLAGCDVFFTSVFTGALSSTEASALDLAYRKGMRVITDADSDTAEQVSANSVMTALGRPAPFTGALDCPNDAAGGVVRAAGPGDPAVYGPFGDLRTNTWGTSITAAMTTPNRPMARCGTSIIRNVAAAKLFVGGDPSGFDLFTSPSGSLFNPTNEAAYLNFIGSAH
jgi:hypothetical protein